MRDSSKTRLLTVRTIPAFTGLLLFYLHLAALAGDSGGFWERSFSEAREASQEGRRWILVFFPSPEDDVDPPQIQKFSLPSSLSGRALGARVRASEVRELLGRFRVRRLPALVLLGPSGSVLQIWEDRWSASECIVFLRSAIRRHEKLAQELDRKVARARRALLEKRYPDVIDVARDVLRQSREGFPQRRHIQEILAEVGAAADGAFLLVMSREGIVADRQLLAELSRLKQRFPGLSRFHERIDDERVRLRVRRIAGR